MNKVSMYILMRMLLITFVISIASSGFAEQKTNKIHNAIEDYTECNGLLIFISNEELSILNLNYYSIISIDFAFTIF